VFLSVDATLIVQVVNFIVFLLVLNVVFTRPVGAAIAKRRAYINSLSADTEQAEADLKALHAQADGKRAAARREAADLLVKARGAAHDEAAALAAGAASRASAIVAAAQQTVAAELAEARTKEDDIVAALSRTLLERALDPGAAA